MNKGKVEYVSHHGSEEFISKVAGISHNSKKGPDINKLLDWGHFSPLEFASITFKMKTPIFVARQLFRHRTGKFMEKSLRYTQSKNDFFIPDNKYKQIYEMTYESAFKSYDALIENGVEKEQARTVLPLGVYTEFYVQFDLRNLMNLLLLRLASDTQKETKSYAEQMFEILKIHFPNIANYILKNVKK